jgi:peroxiredoxin Q/BCP
MSDMPQAQDAAPAFEAPVFPGPPAFPKGKVKLSQFKGKKNVVLYFYPRDDTPGCTKEACGFRDHYPDLEETETVVLGVSTDTVASHEKFAGKFSLPFPLIADEDHSIAEKYGVWKEKSMYGRRYMGIERSTFVIDPDGKVAEIYDKVKVKGHVEDVLGKT